MNTETYTYSLLQYRHSQILGEVLNIGLLVYYKNSNKLEFIYPEKLIRLRFAYPNVPEKTIKAYYKGFEDRVNVLNKRPELFAAYDLNDSLDKFIGSELLPQDSSALQFSKTKKAIAYIDDTTIISNQLYNLYFTVFEHNSNIIQKVSEGSLLREYKKFLLELDARTSFRNNDNIIYDYEISPTKNKPFKFEVAWQGKEYLNLVKPISFDVVREESLRNKAYRFYGQFLDLEEYATKNNCQFDLILGKPKDKGLFKNYDLAVELLQKPKRVHIIEENNLKEYSIKTLSNLEKTIE